MRTLLEIPLPVLVTMACYAVVFCLLMVELALSKGVRLRARAHPVRYIAYSVGVLFLSGYVYAKETPPPPKPDAPATMPMVVKIVAGEDGMLHILFEPAPEAETVAEAAPDAAATKEDLEDEAE